MTDLDVEQPKEYTRLQRFLYDSKRHVLPLLILILPLLALVIFADPVWLQDTLHVVMTAIPRIGVLVAGWLLIMTFVFPKLGLQNRIKDDPLAVAVFAGLLLLSIAITL